MRGSTALLAERIDVKQVSRMISAMTAAPRPALVIRTGTTHRLSIDRSIDSTRRMQYPKGIVPAPANIPSPAPRSMELRPIHQVAKPARLGMDAPRTKSVDLSA